MSLQLLAKQMEAKGRKGDSMLVHMTAKEVAALQKMAESAGGSLSVNPETGLVEANFLKRLLPTLVGAGLMLTPGGMPLALAGGALVGGIQAKQDDKDFLTGALMGGLGAYGGASLAGGLTAAAGAPVAGGATVAAPATAAQTFVPGANVATGAGSQASIMNPMALAGGTTPGMTLQGAAPVVNTAGTTAPTTFSGKLTQAGEGIGRLGDVQGRAAFGKEFGFKQGMAGLAPMLMPEDRKMADAPVDDEMFSYTFDPGATDVASQPMASSAERRHFRNEFSPMRRIRASEFPVYAAQGGLMQLAEGGQTGATAEAMNYLMGDSGASQAGLSYLMGNSSQSPVMPNTMSPQSPMAQPSPTPMDSNQMFSFDPTSGTFTRNPGYEDPEDRVKRIAAEQAAAAAAAAPQQTFGGYASGGIASMAKGGMASGGFVVPADVVSALGNGSTDAGLRKLNAMMGDVKPIKGKGDGLSDSIPTNIDGKQPARVADGEAYIDPKTVKRLGGAKKLYALMDKVREQAHGKTTQQRKVNPAKVMA